MTRFWKVFFLLQILVAFCAAQEAAVSSNGTPRIAAFTAPKVQHAYGLAEAKPKEKAALTINSLGISFIGKTSSYTMPWHEITAVSTGSEKVELWGTTGRIV